jgi:hypothetical protein
MTFCLCGCGSEVKRQYISGHNRRKADYFERLNDSNCRCGCGQKLDNPLYHKFIRGHQNTVFKTGEKNNRWKGGRFIKDGYVFMLCKGHHRADADGYVLEQVLVIEAYLGRPIYKEIENIHHKNGIKTDNRIENLQLLSNSEHTLLHWKHFKDSGGTGLMQKYKPRDESSDNG